MKTLPKNLIARLSRAESQKQDKVPEALLSPVPCARTAWWHEQQDEVMDGFLVEPQNQGRDGLRGSRVMSGDWRRLHRIRGVSSGSPENHWVPWLIHKAKTEEPKMVVQQLQTGLTGGSDRSDRRVPV
jgi:hypothetical protein